MSTKKQIYSSSRNLYLVIYFNSDYISNRLNRKSIFKYIFIIDKKSIATILKVIFLQKKIVLKTKILSSSLSIKNLTNNLIIN